MTTSLKNVTLDDKYTQDQGRVFLNGTQALVRLPLMQKRLDSLKGLKTAGFISGYRGSPLGAYDQALWRAQRYLKDHSIEFSPGINEDLGATAVWGSQQVHLSPQATVQGVFGLWYGKGPGVDRTGDVFKHANAAGSSQYGGVLAIAGDDHACKSSTLPHQTEYAFMDAFMPVIHPATVQEILELGLMGWALSRYAGVWVAFKTISDSIDTSTSIHINLNDHSVCLPEDFIPPPGGLNLRWPDSPLDQERRLHDYKLKAIPAFVKANQLDKKIWLPRQKPRIALISVGKAYLDLRQALDNLGITPQVAEELGIILYKVAVSWPLEPSGILSICYGLEEVIVIEEKRPLLESQIKDILYHCPASHRPRVVGKLTHNGAPLLPTIYELSAAQIAKAVASRLKDLPGFERFLPTFEKALNGTENLSKKEALLNRVPYYCSGCPHNTSTMQLPKESRALAGIGCHYMATWIHPATQTFTQMGGEGVPWIGISPFTTEKHIFSNMGDGTYYHSGLLAIRAAVAGRVNITYKILYNDAVAMTGGQPVDGPLSVSDVTHQLKAEGIHHIAVVSDDIKKYKNFSQPFATGVTLHDRANLMDVQENFKNLPGVTAIIYDQTCAAEKRRRRKRKLMEDPNRRIFINDAVCEGCGDCGKKSNCLSIVPKETVWGRKRAIDQSSCNKDFSCVNGFCPSFVSVIGGRLRKPDLPTFSDELFSTLPTPYIFPLQNKPFNLFITGVGGTGVVTIGSLLGMAAHLENKACSVVDMAGLAQKGGAVVSHVRLSDLTIPIYSTRISHDSADLILGFDIVVSTAADTLQKVNRGVTQAVVNDHQIITGHFTQDPNYFFPLSALKQDLSAAIGSHNLTFLDFTKLATRLMGDSIMSNLLMVGYALQKGLLPLSVEAIEKAIELNNVSVSQNLKALSWGRLMAAHPEKVADFMKDKESFEDSPALSLDDFIEKCRLSLTHYQNEAYGQKFLGLVSKVKEKDQTHPHYGLTWAAAKSYHRLLAYKDEYEVGRLYTDGSFLKQLNKQFEGDYKLMFHLAPPLLSKKDKHTQELKKRTFGPWIFYAFKVLAKFKFLRGTFLDIFGYTAERKKERHLIGDFETTLSSLLEKLTPQTYLKTLEIIESYQLIRGFGHVKEKNYTDIQTKIKGALEQI